MDVLIVVYFLLIGSFVGVAAGMFGIGGGAILVPLLTSIFISLQMPQAIHLALGTSMSTIIITSFSSLRAQDKKGCVEWGVFKLIVPGVLVGTFLGTFLASNIKSLYLGIFFAIFMLFVSLQLFFSKQPKTSTNLLASKFQILAGFIIGGISSLVSIGGGTLSVPYLSWQGIDIKKAIGTSSAIGFPLAIAGSFGYVYNGLLDESLSVDYAVGYVYLPAVFFVALASYLTAPLGVKLMHKLPSKNIKKIFSFIPFALSLKMLYELYKVA